MFSHDSRILIIDDLRTIRKILQDCLMDLGFTNIDEADQGETGLKMMKEAIKEERPYKIIFSDWNMPKFTGIDLLRAKNSDSSLKNTPFIMVTIESEKEYVLEAITMGVDDFIVKPFSTPIIEEKLKLLWDRRLNLIS